MSYPYIIERQLELDEFSIFLDNSEPIPLADIAKFLGKIAKFAQSAKGMKGGFIQLSDFAVGSCEMRFRVIGPGRIQNNDEERQNRLVAAAEKSATAGTYAAGIATVSTVVAALALAIESGDANPSVYHIVNQYNVQNIFIQTANDNPYIITREAINKNSNVSRKTNTIYKQIRRESEIESLKMAMELQNIVKVAGIVRINARGNSEFETMNGNFLPIIFPDHQNVKNTPLVVRAIVQGYPDNIALKVVDIITELSNL